MAAWRRKKNNRNKNLFHTDTLRFINIEKCEGCSLFFFSLFCSIDITNMSTIKLKKKFYVWFLFTFERAKPSKQDSLSLPRFQTLDASRKRHLNTTSWWWCCCWWWWRIGENCVGLRSLLLLLLFLKKKLKVREGERERKKEEKNLNKTYTKRTNDNGWCFYARKTTSNRNLWMKKNERNLHLRIV